MSTSDKPGLPNCFKRRISNTSITKQVVLIIQRGFFIVAQHRVSVARHNFKKKIIIIIIEVAAVAVEW